MLDTQSHQWKTIVGVVAFLASIATIIALVVQLESRERDATSAKEQVASQDAQIALQKTQIALSAEHNRILAEQGTVTAKQAQAQQQLYATPTMNERLTPAATTLANADAQIRGTPTADTGFSPTATALAEIKRSTEATRQALDIQRQRVEATQTALAKAPPTVVPAQPQVTVLSDCGSFAKGETRTVSRGTFAIGDVYVNDMQQFDNGDGEGTVVFFERTGIVRAPFGAGCYLGSAANLEEIVQQQFRDGCGSGCSSVRVVIVKTSGEQNVSYRR